MMLEIETTRGVKAAYSLDAIEAVIQTRHEDRLATAIYMRNNVCVYTYEAYKSVMNQIRALEDREDYERAVEIMEKEKGQPSIPLDQIKRELEE